MDKKISNISSQPDYKRIYTDIVRYKYPEKEELCMPIFSKEHISALDVIELNTIIFSQEEERNRSTNQRHRSYDKSAIFKILDHQKKYNLNNNQLAAEFDLSRNTVAKWKKLFM